MLASFVLESFPRAAAYASAHVTRRIILHPSFVYDCTKNPFADEAPDHLHRLLSHTLHARVLNPALLPPALQAIRRAIFPDDALGPARVPPSDDEVVAIRRECARVIVEIVPPYVRSKYFVTGDVAIMRGDVEESLDLFADSFINKHLIVDIVELIFLRLFPEIGEE